MAVNALEENYNCSLMQTLLRFQKCDCYYITRFAFPVCSPLVCLRANDVVLRWVSRELGSAAEGIVNRMDAVRDILSCAHRAVVYGTNTSGDPIGVTCISGAVAVAPGIVCGIIALIFVIIFSLSVLKKDAGNERMREIATAIQVGARAFLVKEYTYLAVFVAIMAVFIGLATMTWQTPLCFIVGALLSASAGWIGMQMAVRANVRTTAAARIGLNDALRVAFKSGAVMGLTVVGLGIVGLAVLFLLFGADGAALQYVTGFGFGASSIALFARVGGGIYTKAADVGADLVGKVEAGIPEDDPRNPATIADNVGDNVGDVAGMGADLFESYVGSIIAACTLGTAQYANNWGAGIAIPFWISGFGIICAIIGTFMVRTKDSGLSGNALQERLLRSIRIGIYGSSFLVILAIIGAVFGISNIGGINAVNASNPITDYNAAAASWDENYAGRDDSWFVIAVVAIGLLAGIGIGYFTEYYTSFQYSPTRTISEASNTGHATVIIRGLGVGMLSCVPPVVIMVIAILASYLLLNEFGVAIAAVGMLSTLGVTLATDAYGPVADNAGGIAEMAELEESVRDRTDALDALGNTTAATGKGFAIGSAVLTALALMSAFTSASGLTDINIDDPIVMCGIIFGALLPFVFASLTMLAVGRSAMSIIEEVRYQIHNIPGIMDGTGKPDYDRCVRYCTKSAVKEMILPGGLAVISPIAFGLVLGGKGLAGLLTGSISSGFLLAVTMANTGGAWDNAKKWCEAGGLGEGKGKGSECHKACVTGDTVGDPFKDTSGPSLNILIKLMSVVSLLLANAGFFPSCDFSQQVPFAAPEVCPNGGLKWLIGLGILALAIVLILVMNCIQKRSENERTYATFENETEMKEAGEEEEERGEIM